MTRSVKLWSCQGFLGDELQMLQIENIDISQAINENAVACTACFTADNTMELTQAKDTRKQIVGYSPSICTDRQ